MKKIKKLICIGIITISLLNFCILNYSYADDMDEEENEIITNNEIEEVSKNVNTEPTFNSRKCAVYDRKSKMIIYGKNKDVKCAMASTTKIMTATVVLENVADLNKIVTVTSKAAGTGGSRLGLKKNDKITINDLLYGLMLRSGNDAAVALAIEVGGSVEGFATLMNQKAESLGLVNTHFVTPHGLDDPEHYTTATELAKLTDYALKNKTFANIVGTKNYTITINGYAKALNNTNELLGSLNGVVGVKTGFTNGAGRCLVTEVKRGDKDLITIVLGADTKKDRTKDSIKLIEYAFSNFEKINIKEQAIEAFNKWKEINSERIEIIKGKSDKIKLRLGNIEKTEILVSKEQLDNVKYEIKTITSTEAPVQKGQQIGTLTISKNDDIIEIVDIVCDKTIEKKDWLDYFVENIKKCRMIFLHLYS